MSWQDVANKAIEDEAFAALEKERQAIREAAGDVFSRVAGETVGDADDLTSPDALLNATGIGPQPVDDPVLRRLTFRLKHVLCKLGFSCETVVRESLKAIVGKISWTAKFCVEYFDFLTQPADDMNEYLVWLGESFFYAGDGEKQSVVPGVTLTL